ncbi:MAG: hypothetical protein ACI8QZ_004048 [Chlamydiales bacterium]|jgi:hypothetical protein
MGAKDRWTRTASRGDGASNESEVETRSPGNLHHMALAG